MKNRELRAIAKTIVKCEKILSNENSSTEDRNKAMAKIVEVSNQFENLDDMQAVDEMVLNLLDTNT